MKIMVTGANGGYGRYAVDYVRGFAPEAEVYGLVRKAQDAEALEAKGVHARIGDYADKATLVAAFEGIDRLLFVSVPTHELQENVVEAAKEAGVSFIAYTSLHDPQYAKFGLEVNHRETEELIAASDIEHAFLRDGWYLEMAAPLAVMAAKTGVFPYFAGESKVAWALKREYAEAGARLVTGGGYPEVIELAGEPVSWREMGEAAARVAGREVEVRPVAKDEFAALVAEGGLDQMSAMLSTVYQDYAVEGGNGEAESTSAQFVDVLGHPLATLDEALRELGVGA